MTAGSPVSAQPDPALGACPHCDLLYRRTPLQPGERGYCPRCGARLYRRSRLGAEGMLAIAVAALVCFGLANAYPIVELSVQGLRSAATLFGSVVMLWAEGHALTAILVFVTTQAIPLADLVVTIALLAATLRRERTGRHPPWFPVLLHLLHQARPWGMVEVFMLGVVVSLVKLVHLAHLVPGVALWAFAALAVMMTLIQSFDLHALWDEAPP